MLEILLCSMLTVLPDYLYRRYVQGKRIGKEITLFSVWYELRWGIVSCLMLTVALITAIFYFHPSTTAVNSFFRTVPVLPESGGRVAEIYVKISDKVEQGSPIFRLDDSAQKAAVETSRKRILEVEAQFALAKADLAAAEGQIQVAQGALKQATDELETKRELNRRNPDIVARRELERLETSVAQRKGSVDAAAAAKQSVETRLSVSLPAQKASAEASLSEAEVALAKTVVRAGVSGQLEQFALRVGDVVNPLLRPAGILIPADAGRRALVAGFGQIEGQVMKPGMLAEATCVSKPWTVIPLVVTDVQDYIAAGQLRGGEVLIDPRQAGRPGTIVVFLEPLYEKGLEGVIPGSSCIANAYTSNHERLSSESVGAFKRVALHAVDAVGVVHALLLRIQALILPIKDLVFSGH